MSLASVAATRKEIDALRAKLTLAETEETWDIITDALQRLESACSNGASDYPEELIPAIRSLSRTITSAMCSERTRLSGAALDLVSSIASSLGSQYDPLLPLLFPTLLTLCSRTNRVVLARARASILTTIETTQLPAILTYLLQAVKDKAASLRLVAAEGTLACINCFNPPDLERENRAMEIEAIVRTTAKDANPDVRKISRQIFEAYKLVLPGRLSSFVAPLTPTTRKYLNISSKAQGVLPPPVPRAHIPKAKSVSNLGQLQSLAGSKPPLRSLSRPPSRVDPITLSAGPVRQDGLPMIQTALTSKDPQRLLPGRAKAQSSRSDPRNANRSQRPASATGQRELTAEIVAPLQLSIASGPRRIPAPTPMEPTIKASLPSRTQITSHPARKPMVPQPSSLRVGALSHNPSRPQEGSVTKAKPKAATRGLPTKSTATVVDAPPSSASSSKPRDLTQPTQAQLARIRARKEAAPSAAAKRPGVGRRPRNEPTKPIGKAGDSIGMRETASSNSGPSQKCPSLPEELPEEIENAAAVTAASIPLPPSPPGEVSPELNEAIPVSDGRLADPPFPDLRNAMTIDAVGTPLSEFSTNDLFALHYQTAKTPISALLSSIHHGFLLSPSSPLSPPAAYAPAAAVLTDTESFQLKLPQSGTTSTPDQGIEKDMTIHGGGRGEDISRTVLRVVDIN